MLNGFPHLNSLFIFSTKNHMKYFIVLIGMLFFTVHSNAQTTNNPTCLDFHQGKFYYLDSLQNKVLVTRKKRKQIEYNEKTTVKSVFKIKWKSDCEYELKQIWTDSKSHRKFNGGISTTILSKVIDSNSYEYTCGCKDEKLRIVQGTMRRVL